MTDFMLQAATRQDVLDDLAEAIGETLPAPNQVSSAGNLQKIWGDGYRILISWKDNYSSGLKDGLPDAVPVPTPETRVNRGLHGNLRVVGDRGEEISGLIEAYFAKQTKSTRDWADDKVFQARGKSDAGQVLKTARGTSWLQGDDPAEDGYVEDQSFIFG